MDMQHDVVFLHYQDERVLISRVTLCWCPFEGMLLRKFPVIATQSHMKMYNRYVGPQGKM